MNRPYVIFVAGKILYYALHAPLADGYRQEGGAQLSISESRTSS